jgi:hypothetical protein
MAANQTSNQRSGQQTGQRSQSGGQQSQSRGQSQHSGQSGGNSGGQSQSESSGVYGAMSDMAEQASDYVAEGASQVQECIREYSGTAVVVSLVAGFGIGLAIGKALSSSHSEPQTWRDRIAAEGLGRRLMDSIESIIPDALAEHFTK